MVKIQYYIQQLFNHVQRQQEEISKLQAAVEDLTAEIKRLKETPAITVERLEYKFDQLKVEQLEGTLNIGLNPSDLSKHIEDLAIPNQTSYDRLNEKAQFHHPLLNEIRSYVDTHVDDIIQKIESETGRNIDPSYHEIIRKDIHKQLPNRIEHYLQYFSKQNRDIPQEELSKMTYDTIIADINKGIHAFISQLPKMNEEEG